MVYLVYRMRLTPRSQRDLKAFWSWLEHREQWFYRDLPMVSGVRWFLTVVGELYTLECWAAFESEAAIAQYREVIASRKADSAWEAERVSQGDWWEFLDSRVMTDVPPAVGFGQFGASTSSHSPAAPTRIS